MDNKAKTTSQEQARRDFLAMVSRADVKYPTNSNYHDAGSCWRMINEAVLEHRALQARLSDWQLKNKSVGA